MRIMPSRLVPLVWCRTKTFPHVGRILHLIPICALLLVTTWVTCWKSYVMFEPRAHLPTNARLEAGILFRTLSLRGMPRFLFMFSWWIVFSVVWLSRCIRFRRKKALIDSGGDWYLSILYLLILAHLLGLRRVRRAQHVEPYAGLFCHEHVGAIMEAYLDDVVLGRIALS